MTRPGFSSITVTLPTLVVVALHDMVEGSEQSISDLLAGWLLRSISPEDMQKVADKHPEFKPLVEAWLTRYQSDTDQSGARKRKATRKPHG